MSHVTTVIESCHKCEWVMSHIWMSHVIIQMNESCHTREWITCHTIFSHVPHMHESCHTHEWVASHMNGPCQTHMNESYHTREWESWHTHEWLMWRKKYHTNEQLTSNTPMSHFTHVNKSCRTNKRDTSHDAWIVSCQTPQMEEIGLKIMTTAKISTNFRGSPRNFRTDFQNFKQDLTGENGNLCYSKNRPQDSLIWRSKYFKSDILRERHTWNEASGSILLWICQIIFTCICTSNCVGIHVNMSIINVVW